MIRIHKAGDGPPPTHLEAIPEVWLDVLDESIRHRGPDGQGRFRDRAMRDDGTVVDVALVHRRLSIIDHAGGYQPMVHDGERLRADLTYQPGETPIVASEVAPGLPIVAVVFNGCIYNHRELRAELEDAGYVFSTDHSDTEVLVHGWREWGAGWDERVADASMFAVIGWDRTDGSVWCGRDFFGQKPLYSALPSGSEQDSGNTLLVLGSNAGGAAAALDRLTADAGSVATWATFGHALGRGPMRGMGSLPPRQSAWIRASGAEEQSTPDEPIPRVLRRRNRDELDRLLRERVEERLEADVPVACLLSGGIDSSLVSAYAQQATGRVRTITVRMPDARYDESVHAQRVAEHLGTEHVVVDTQENAAEDLVTMIELAGIPFGDSSLLPTFWACRAAREHAGVLLTGDGGDELFVGYQRHFAARWIGLLAIPGLLGYLCPTCVFPRRSAVSRGEKGSRMLEAVRRGSYEVLLGIFPPSDAKRLLGRTRYRYPWWDAEDEPWEAALDDLDFMLPSDYLRKVDLASMMAGVETRSPFLDRRVLWAALQLKSKLINNGQFLWRYTPKGMLRDVARLYLPDSIVDRPKQGFAIPVGEWFRSDYGGMRQLLHDHMNSRDPFPGLGDAGVEIDMGFVRTMMREHDAAGEKSIDPWHGRDHSQRLYMMLVLSIWARWLDRVRRGEG
ncbi:MAG: 7-cyano-7-deazaguanine synthase [Phycisphaerales bacterium]|nr:7-cyano-7-deazaguanine synthase [Phycisphaerales bacterium]